MFGPDTSTEWIPVWHVLAYYAVFFAFGALLYGRPNRRRGQLVESIGRWWPVLLPVTAIIFSAALDLTFDEDASWTAASIGQVAFAWLAIVTLMGLFRTLLAKERRGVRYLSDSAYWLYLAHLPIVIWGQVWIRNWDLPAAVKFVGLTTAVTVLLLIFYQLFVRYTAARHPPQRQTHPPEQRVHHTGTDTKPVDGDDLTVIHSDRSERIHNTGAVNAFALVGIKRRLDQFQQGACSAANRALASTGIRSTAPRMRS